MQIVIVVIILLVTAMVVLSIFGGQMGGITKTMSDWLGGVGEPAKIKGCSEFGGACSPIGEIGECTSVNYVAPCPAGQVCCIK